MAGAAPRVDIYAIEKDLVAERDELIIRGRVERPATTPDYQEFDLANCYRAFTLTDDLDTEGITARLRDGVLRVEIPKSARSRAASSPRRVSTMAMRP